MRIYHLKWPNWKHMENSIRGIRKAARLGYDAIDLDLLITKDGVIVCCHWMRPLLRDNFYDRLRRIKLRAQVKKLTWAEVKRLRSKDGDYRIIRIERALEECAKQRIIAYLEPKSLQFAASWPWLHIKAVAKKYGTKVRVRALPQNAAALPFARRVGFRTKEIK